MLIGDNSLVEVLRCLTSIELFLNSNCYGKHCCFELAFNSQKGKIRSLHYFFCLSLKSATLDNFSSDNISTVKNEAILNCKDFEWSSFMCLLGLSSVLKCQVLSYFVCVLFCNKVVTRKKKLVHLPYSGWSDAQAQFKRHVNAVNGIHSESIKNYSSFLNEMTGKVVPVNVQVNQTSEPTKKNNRILLLIIDLLKTAGRMGIPLRGDRDDSKYHPEVGEPATYAGVGNFVEFLNFAVRQGNKDLEAHLKNCSSRETYISKTTQNNLLNCCYDLMKEAIISKVKQVRFFSVLCDEASDSANKEQLSFCLRYIDENDDICEDFLKYIHCPSGLTGKDLYNEIISSLESFNLDIQNCCGQGYDGAGAVAGKVNGLAALFLKENPKALYPRCASHRQNLAICSPCDIVSVRNLMITVKYVKYFFKFSPIRADHLEKFILSKEEGKKVKTKLLDPSRTRCVARIDGLELFEDEFVSVVKTLEFFCLNPKSKVNRDTVSRSQTLLNHLSNFPFIVTLVFTRKIFD